jgi:hypothetical protein
MKGHRQVVPISEINLGKLQAEQYNTLTKSEINLGKKFGGGGLDPPGEQDFEIKLGILRAAKKF